MESTAYEYDRQRRLVDALIAYDACVDDGHISSDGAVSAVLMAWQMLDPGFACHSGVSPNAIQLAESSLRKWSLKLKDGPVEFFWHYLDHVAPWLRLRSPVSLDDVLLWFRSGRFGVWPALMLEARMTDAEAHRARLSMLSWARGRGTVGSTYIEAICSLGDA